MKIHNFTRSLSDLLGEDYINGVCQARAALTGEDPEALLAIAHEQVAFCPDFYMEHQDALMQKVGQQLCPAAPASVRTMNGAPTASFAAAQNDAASPMSTFGCFRLGEDGRLYFAGKSEHYQLTLGHGFPGYRLIENAKKLGIPNATHNNTRGYVTRTLEQRLIAAANGLQPEDPAFPELLKKQEPGVLNRVLNLETGSLVAEAALKMMLSMVYTIGGQSAKYEGRIPVFLVMSDNAGGITAGYHGTTFFAQTLRGLWPKWLKAADAAYRVESVRINDAADFEEKIEKWNRPPYKTVGFCHEIVMMNYCGIVLTPEYLQEAYRLCRSTDTPVLCDEIQSGAWYDSLFLFRKYNIHPDFVSIGKGFPGGEYPASRLLVSGAYDSLNQFGALVTNGQEELASLSYLITMEFLKENGTAVTEIGEYYHQQAVKMAARHPAVLADVRGELRMTSFFFHDIKAAETFCHRMNHECCIDLSAQTYKPNCPPAVLTKVPVIASAAMIDLLLASIEKTLTALES